MSLAVTLLEKASKTYLKFKCRLLLYSKCLGFNQVTYHAKTQIDLELNVKKYSTYTNTEMKEMLEYLAKIWNYYGILQWVIITKLEKLKTKKHFTEEIEDIKRTSFKI